MRPTPLHWPRPGQPLLELTEEQLEVERLKFIPAIKRETVDELLQRITPLLRDCEGVLCKYQPQEPMDPVNVSFTWNKSMCCGQPADARELRLLDAIHTYHTCGYHMAFRPKIAEVLAQIPEHLLERVSAFEVLFGQEPTECVDYPGLYGHKTVTLLYGGKV